VPAAFGGRAAAALEVGGDPREHRARFALEPEVGDAGDLDPDRQQVVGAFAVALEGERRAVGGEDVEFDPEALRRPVAVDLVGADVEPPKALAAPKPTSSSRMIRTLGAPCGGRSGSIGANEVSGSLAS
jgi:hypothetical protein